MTAHSKRQNHFTEPLLQWYKNAGRSLPWRMTRDPYAIWVSEIMLQQTQVATALPYYHRFLGRFPDIKALAEAELESVLMLWQGLGYYARARNLHKAAQEMLARHQGRIPEDFKSLLALPGIGRSSAGAILSIAFGQRHPILDGNVRRVLCRFFAIEADPKDKAVEAELWAHSENLLPQENAGLFQQAIMDIGATCCLPKQPQCERCPLKSHCGAFEKGLQEVLPLRKARQKSPHFDYFAAVIRCGEQVLIRRRPLKGLLAGLWEFPGERVGLASEGCDMRVAGRAFLKHELGADISLSHPWMEIKHVFSHFKMTLHVFSASLKSTSIKTCVPEKALQCGLLLKWVSLGALSDYPFSAAHLRIAKRLFEEKDHVRLFQ